MLNAGRLLRGFGTRLLAALLLLQGAATASAAAPAASSAPASAATSASTVTSLQANGDVTTVTVTGSAARAPAFAPDRVLVRFRNGPEFLPGSGRAVALAAGRGLHLVANPPGLSVAETLARYRANPRVVYAEPDYLVSAFYEPTDPDYVAGRQWDMTKIAAPAAWTLDRDAGSVVVAVVDTGIDYNHPDLVANLWAHPSNAAVHGYTCSGGVCAAGGQDDHGHGTHVAGTIGAAGDNGIGIAGENFKVQLLAIKFLGSGGSGSISDAVAGFELLRQLKAAGINIRVTNNSWGGGGYSQSLKDAMAALESGAPGTLNVCAAGNSGANADFTPMYPAAYDNRGILSVLATDVNDLGASFTNYGLSSVDLAAPGVSTYSTAPTGTCSLCDPTGYKSLSGTSMASPHVAGVAAALLDRHPGLTAAQARDALLHPASYDAMANERARWTSSGGRLNFLKALTNTAFLDDPVLNQFPSVTVGPDVTTGPGGTVNFTQSATDPDGDTLRTMTGRGSASSRSVWLFGWQAQRAFPSALPFTAPALARVAVMPYDTAVADNRGGGASGRNWAVVTPAPTPGGAPTGVLTVPATGTVNVAVPIQFVASDPEGGAVAWDNFAAGYGGAGGACCFTGTAVSRIFSTPGTYRISVQGMDPELNVSPNYSAVIRIADASGVYPALSVPPIAEATLDRTSGPAPFTVNVEMAASSDPDGYISYYFNDCGGGYAVGRTGSLSSCTFTQPGSYWLMLHVRDNAGNLGLTQRYVVVTPAVGPPPDSTPPVVSITSPAAGATVSGSVTLAASASDQGGSGMKEVEYYLDTVSAAASLGIATADPYAVSWNASGAAPGTHVIHAVARDNAGNSSLPEAVSVTVPAPLVLPAVTISPSGTISLARGAVLTVAAVPNAPTYGIARVDFLLNNKVVLKDTAAPYEYRWTVPNRSSTYSFQVKLYDGRGNVASSAVLKVVVK